MKRCMQHIRLLGMIAAAAVLMVACRKEDYKTGGSPTNPRSELSTYDYLKQNKLFDTLVMLIDKAGMKEEINSNVTFFAVTNYSVYTLLAKRTGEIQKKYNNENIKYTLDSFPIAELKDSLRAYVFKSRITREELSLDNQFYKNAVGEDFVVKLRVSDDYGELNNPPKYMYLRKVINGLDPDPIPNKYPDADKDIEEIIQTSGILTKTGVLHVINNNHTFYWKSK